MGRARRMESLVSDQLCGPCADFWAHNRANHQQMIDDKALVASLEAKLARYKEAFEADWNAPHVVHLAEDGWRLQHPLRCHDNLDACDWNEWCDAYAEQFADQLGHGFYTLEMAGGYEHVEPCEPHRLALNIAAALDREPGVPSEADDR